MAEFEHPAGATFLNWMKQIPNNGLIHYRGPLHENILFVAGPNALQASYRSRVLRAFWKI